jgi:hypothetical protein
MGILWKIYFWLLAGLFLLGLLVYEEEMILFEIETNLLESAYDSAMLLVLALNMLGLYGFVFQKRLFSKDFWKFVFLLTLIHTAGELSYVLLDKGFPMPVVSVILISPFVYALYRYAFSMPSIWGNKIWGADNG